MEHLITTSEEEVRKIYPNAFLEQFLTKKKNDLPSQPFPKKENRIELEKDLTAKFFYPSKTFKGIKESIFKGIDFTQLYECTYGNTQRQKFYINKAKNNIKQILKKRKNNIKQQQHNIVKPHSLNKLQRRSYRDYSHLNKKTLKKQSNSYKYICKNLKKEAQEDDFINKSTQKKKNLCNLDNSKSKITTSKNTITIQKQVNRLPLGREKYFNIEALKKMTKTTTQTTSSIQYDQQTPDTHINLYSLHQHYSTKEKLKEINNSQAKTIEFIKNRYKKIVELYEHDNL